MGQPLFYGINNSYYYTPLDIQKNYWVCPQAIAVPGRGRAFRYMSAATVFILVAAQCGLFTATPHTITVPENFI